MKNLTPKELEILKLVIEGYGNYEISKTIFLSTHTVKAHISAIIKKLNAKNRTNAATIALRERIID